MRKTNIQEMKVPNVALGTWSWGFGGIAGGDSIFGNKLGEEDLKPVFDKAMSLGLTLWDTATVYASGASETILGNFVKDRKDAIISTKFTPNLAEGRGEDAMQKLFDESCERLYRNEIEIYWIHNTQDVIGWTNKLIDLLKTGRVKKVGVSNHNLEQVKYVHEALKAAGYRLDAIQNHYSLIYRTIETTGILEYCKEENIAVFSYMVLEQGALSGKYTAKNPLPARTRRGEAFPVEILEKLEPLFAEQRRLAEKYNVGEAIIPTAWAIGKGTIPIIGVTKVEQVVDAELASNIELTEEEILMLEKIAENTGVFVKGGWESSM
ncbi:aldo/keto reductase [Gemella cuniculi]|uniref:aldo/keto reductase n=1 Tax=Gemella cuniculi TaxID=150240 RepID=UPI00041CD8B4|nr:aldo/keto reductase [Gemella cuniculi]